MTILTKFAKKTHNKVKFIRLDSIEYPPLLLGMVGAVQIFRTIECFRDIFDNLKFHCRLNTFIGKSSLNNRNSCAILSNRNNRIQKSKIPLTTRNRRTNPKLKIVNKANIAHKGSLFG